MFQIMQSSIILFQQNSLAQEVHKAAYTNTKPKKNSTTKEKNMTTARLNKAKTGAKNTA